MSERVLTAVRTSGVVAIVRTADADSARRSAEQLLEYGLPVVEVSLTTPGAETVIADVLRNAPDAFIGAGTVVGPEAAQRLLDAGAQFLVSPIFEPSVVSLAARSGVATFPGCLTPTEMVSALGAGATAAKIFPAHVWSPAALAGLLQALPHMPCVPTGGIAPSDAAAWIRAGAVAVGIGSALTSERDPAGAVQRLRESIGTARSGLSLP